MAKSPPLKINISRVDAALYNKVTQAFFDAQMRFREKNGILWTPDIPLDIHVKKFEMKRYNYIGSIINKAIETAARTFQEEDLHEDFLVKN